jgi:D-glycero-alpha-D-manno-heptose-7-phosphate kinase
VILTRTPLRLSIAGGGTDDPTYAAEHGGYAVTAGIDKYVFIGVSNMFTPGYFLKYSETEHVKVIDDIQHPILREALRYFCIPPHVEVVSLADIPAGTGLGSSAAFTVGLCNALSLYNGIELSQEQAGYHAAHVELNILERPGGRQDHIACAMGGMTELRFGDRSVEGQPLQISKRMTARFEKHLALFYTGRTRSADSILSTQTREGLDEIKAVGHDIAKYMQKGWTFELGERMDEHWHLKRKRHPEMSDDFIDECYDVAMQWGALGGKLVGAGGGGFLLFVFGDDLLMLTQAMSHMGLQYVPFKFDHAGTTVIAR